jgi:hypothetical protein
MKYNFINIKEIRTQSRFELSEFSTLWVIQIYLKGKWIYNWNEWHNNLCCAKNTLAVNRHFDKLGCYKDGHYNHETFISKKGNHVKYRIALLNRCRGGFLVKRFCYKDKRFSINRPIGSDSTSIEPIVTASS